MKRSLTAGGPYALIASDVKGKTYTDRAVVNDTTYYYVVSGSNTMGEGADSNEAAATPKLPSDLIVSAFTVPPSTGAGSTIALSSTIKNQGLGTSNPTTTRFYLTRNATIDASEAVNGVQAVPPLPSGATSTTSVSIDIPSDTAVGTYYLIAKADADSLEIEALESNNTLLRLLTVGPDLVVSVTGPSTAAPGNAILVTDTVKNLGSAAGPSTTRFYLSTDTHIDAADVVLSASRSVPSVAAGGTSSGSASVAIPSTVTTGSYYVIAKADADNTVVETVESNNTGSKLIQIGGDLTVSSLTAPSVAGAGSTIVVGDTVTNSGGAWVPASVTRFYLSAKSLLDASATVLAGGRTVPDLAAGVMSAGSTTLVIPSTFATGGYYLIAEADGDETVPETRETNNTASR